MTKSSAYTNELFLPDGNILLVNLLWRTFIELTPEEQTEWIDIKEKQSSGGPLLKRLVDKKMLFEDQFDELAFMRHAYRNNRHSRHVLGLTIAPTMDCNLSCIYCYESKRGGVLTDETEQHIRRYVDEVLPGRKRLNIIWSGGEPLICRERVLSLSKLFRERARAVGAEYCAQMITNGLLLDADVAAAMHEIGHWTNVQITLDGAAAFHDKRRPARGGRGTFDRIYGNLAEAIKLLPISVRMNVDTANVDGCVALLEQLAADIETERLHVYFAPIHFFGKGCQDVAKSGEIEVFDHATFAQLSSALTQKARELGFKTNNEFAKQPLSQCQAVSTHSIIIEPDGALHRCWTEVGEDEKRVGHISEPVALNEPNSLRWLRFDPTVSDPCRSCLVLPSCFGGCPQRHIDGRPLEMICSTIRFNTKSALLDDYITLHRPDLADAVSNATTRLSQCEGCGTTSNER